MINGGAGYDDEDDEDDDNDDDDDDDDDDFYLLRTCLILKWSSMYQITHASCGTVFVQPESSCMFHHCHDLLRALRSCSQIKQPIRSHLGHQR